MFKKYRKKPVVPIVIEAAKWENNMRFNSSQVKSKFTKKTY